MYRHLIQISCLSIGLSCLSVSAMAMQLSDNESCKNKQVDNASDMINCGQIEGSLRLNSFSLKNAYFSGISQDTTTAGGYATYKTARYNDFQFAVGIEGQRRLAQGAHSVAELSQHTFGFGEAYINWTHNLFSVTLGNQKLDLPFTGDYSIYRVQPWLYQGIDIKYGDTDNFIRATKVNKYKSYGDDSFSKSNRFNDDPYSGYSHNSDGIISLGLSKKLDLKDQYIKGQFWVEQYQDLLNLYYGEANIGFKNTTWQPELSFQGIYGQDTGDSYLGNIKSKTYGTQLKVKPTDTLTWRVGYDHVVQNNKSQWMQGSLPTPYAHNTSSNPYFAQPFFTSTQDLGPGNFYTTEVTSPIGEHIFAGGRATYADMSAKNAKDMYEVMFYGFYNFSGKLKGFSAGEFIGAQKQQDSGHPFLQNRLTLSYNF